MKYEMKVSFCYAECGEVASTASGCDTDVQPSVAEPVDGGHRRGELEWLM